MQALLVTLRPRRGRTRSAITALLITCALLLGACGGGGGGSAAPINLDAPRNLIYAEAEAMYRTDVAIAPNTVTYEGDPVTGWECTPPLPEGLEISLDGTISGTPTARTDPTDHVVEATNEAGRGSTTIRIEVRLAEEKSLAPKEDPTDADLRHFLDRTHFGFNQYNYDILHQRGLASYVNSMTSFRSTNALEAEARDAYLVDEENDPGGDFPSSTDLARYWLHIMMNTTNPFQENLAFKLHDHFATSTEVLGGGRSHYYIAHINLWRHNGAGNLRQLLIEMSRDQAMLVWLDGINNRDSAPNENFAREFFELFCLGVDIEYTQADIVEAARAFTGYRQRYDEESGKNYIEFDYQRHDHGEKTVLGQTIPAQAEGETETDDYEAMVDIVLSTNEAETGVSRVGQWIMRSLVEYFCYQDPPQEVIDELANQLRDANWELKPVLMTLFQSEAFFSAAAREQFVKGPVEHILGFMRATELVASPANIDRSLSLMGHRPTRPPTVDGWPGGTQWLSAQGMVDRANILNRVTEQERNLQEEENVTALDLLPTPDADAGATVDALAERLNVPLTPVERTQLVTYLDTERNNDGDVLDDPFDPVGEPATAEDRVRGLLWILGQHPTYQVR